MEEPLFMTNQQLQFEIERLSEELLTFIRKLCVHDTQEYHASMVPICYEMFGNSQATINYLKLAKEQIILAYKRRKATEKELQALLSEESDKWAFITIGFDDKKHKPDEYYQLMTKYVERLKLRKFHTSFEYVLEKHRRGADGEIYIHHHAHILMRTEAPKSKIIQYCWEVFKSQVAGKNFIDVKTHKDGVGSFADKTRYISGEKTQSKLECVRLDRSWRDLAQK